MLFRSKQRIAMAKKEENLRLPVFPSVFHSRRRPAPFVLEGEEKALFLVGAFVDYSTLQHRWGSVHGSLCPLMTSNRVWRLDLTTRRQKELLTFNYVTRCLATDFDVFILSVRLKGNPTDFSDFFLFFIFCIIQWLRCKQPFRVV